MMNSFKQNVSAVAPINVNVNVSVTCESQNKKCNDLLACVNFCKTIRALGYDVKHFIDDQSDCLLTCSTHGQSISFYPHKDKSQTIIDLLFSLPTPDIKIAQVDLGMTSLFQSVFKHMLPQAFDKITFWSTFVTLVWNIITSVTSLIRDRSGANIAMHSVSIVLNLSTIILQLCNYFANDRNSGKIAVEKLGKLLISLAVKAKECDNIDDLFSQVFADRSPDLGNVDHEMTKMLAEHAIDMLDEMEPDTINLLEETAKEVPVSQSALGITQTSVEIVITIIGLGVSIFSMVTGHDVDKMFNRAVDLQKNVEYTRKRVGELAYKVAYQYFGLAIGDQAELVRMIDKLQTRITAALLQDPVYFAVNTKRYYELKDLREEVDKFRTFNQAHADASIRSLFQQLSTEHTKLVDLLRKVEQCLASSSVRPETIPFYLVGEDGTGKSWFAENKICDYINEYFDEPKGKIFKLSWGANDHWKEPYGGEACAIQDEFLNTGHKHPLITYMNSVCSSAYFNMAGAFIKNQPCRFRALFLIANKDSCDLSETLEPEAAIAFWSRMIVFRCRRAKGWEIDRNVARHQYKYDSEFRHLVIDVHMMKRDARGGIGEPLMTGLTADAAAKLALDLVIEKDRIFRQLAENRLKDPKSLDPDGKPKPLFSDEPKKEEKKEKTLDSICSPSCIDVWHARSNGNFGYKNSLKFRPELIKPEQCNKTFTDLFQLLVGTLSEQDKIDAENIVDIEIKSKLTKQFFDAWKLTSGQISLACAIVVCELLDFHVCFIDINSNAIFTTKPELKTDPIYIYYSKDKDLSKNNNDQVFYWKDETRFERVNHSSVGQDKFVICLWGGPRQGKTLNSVKLANDLAKLLDYPVIHYADKKRENFNNPAIYVVSDQCEDIWYSNFYDSIHQESIIINSGNFRVTTTAWYRTVFQTGIMTAVNTVRQTLGYAGIDEAVERTITGLRPDSKCEGIIRRIGLVGKLRLVNPDGSVYQCDVPHWTGAEFRVDGGVMYHTNNDGITIGMDYEKMKETVWERLIRFRQKASQLVVTHDPGLASVPAQDWDVHIKVKSRDELYELLSNLKNIMSGYFGAKYVNGELSWGIKISRALLKCKTRAFSVEYFLAPSSVKTFEEWIDFARRTYLALRNDYSDRTVLVEAGNEKVCGISNVIRYTGLRDTNMKSIVNFNESVQKYSVRLEHTGSNGQSEFTDELIFDANEVFNIVNFGFVNFITDDRFAKFTPTQMSHIRDALKGFSSTGPVKQQAHEYQKREAIQRYARDKHKTFQQKFSEFVHSDGMKFACIGISMLAGAATLAAAITGLVKLSRPSALAKEPITFSVGPNSGVKFDIIGDETSEEISCCCWTETNVRSSQIVELLLLAMKNNRDVLIQSPWLCDIVDYYYDANCITRSEFEDFYTTLYGEKIINESNEKRKKKGNNKKKGSRKIDVVHRHIDGPASNLHILLDKTVPGGFRMVAESLQNQSLETCIEFSRPTVQDRATSIVHNNMVGVTCCTQNGDIVARNWAIGIRDKYLVTVAHFVAMSDEVYYEASYTQREQGINVHRTYRIDLISLDRDNEIAIFQLPKQAPSFKNIMNFIVTEDQLADIDKVLVSKPIVTKLGVTFNSRAGSASIVKHTMDNPFTSSGMVDIVKTKGSTVWATFVHVDYSKAAVPFNQPGDCGMPYFCINASNDIAVLCGMHAAGANTSMNKSYGVALTRDYLEAVLSIPVNQSELTVAAFGVDKMLKKAPDNGNLGTVWERLHRALSKPGDVDYCLPMVVLPILQDAYANGDLETPFPFFNSPDMSFLVTCKKYKGVHKSKLKRYPWSDEIVQYIPDLVKPAPLSISQLKPEVAQQLPKDRHGNPSLMASQLIKITDPYDVPDYISTMLSQVEVEYVEHLRYVFDNHPFRKFTLLEAINGPIGPSDPLYGTVEAIDQDTSPGFIGRFVHGKTDKKCYFRPQEKLSCTGKIVYEIDTSRKEGRDLQLILSAALNHAESGIRPIFIMCDSLKDETLPIAKADKAGTRVITGADLPELLLVRMVFGSLLGVTKKYRAVGHCQVGLDPHSEFHFLYHRLLRTGNHFIDGDFSRFDKHLLRKFLVALFRCWAKLMAPSFGTEIYNLANVIAAGLIDAVRLSEGHFWVQHRGLPSGHPLTCLVNSGVNDLMFFVGLKWAWARAMRNKKFQARHLSQAPTVQFFVRNVDFVNLGDDLLIVVNQTFAGVINFKVLQEFYSLLGIDFDTADKDGGSYQFKKGSNTKFLSRTFRSECTPVMGVIKPESISSIAHWGKKMTAEQYQNVVNDLLMEASKMTKAEFSNIHKALNVIQTHIPVDKRIEIPSFEVLQQISREKIHNASYCRPDKAKNIAKMAVSQEKSGLTPALTQVGVMASATASTSNETNTSPSQEVVPKIKIKSLDVKGALPVPNERDLKQNCALSHLNLVKSMNLGAVCIALNVDEASFAKIKAVKCVHNGVTFKVLDRMSVVSALCTPTMAEGSASIAYIDDVPGDLALVDNESLQNSVSYSELKQLYFQVLGTSTQFSLLEEEYPNGSVLKFINALGSPKLETFVNPELLQLSYPNDQKTPLETLLLHKYFKIVELLLLKTGGNHVCVTVTPRDLLTPTNVGPIRSHIVHHFESKFVQMTGDKVICFDREDSFFCPILSFATTYNLDVMYYTILEHVRKHLSHAFDVNLYAYSDNYDEKFIVITGKKLIHNHDFIPVEQSSLDWTAYSQAALPKYREWDRTQPMSYVTFDLAVDEPNSSHLCWLLAYYEFHVKTSQFDPHHMIEMISNQKLSSHNFYLPPYYEDLRYIADSPGFKLFCSQLAERQNYKLLFKTAEMLMSVRLPKIRSIIAFDTQYHAPDYVINNNMQCLYLLGIQPKPFKKYERIWNKMKHAQFDSVPSLLIREQQFLEQNCTHISGTNNQSMGHVAPPTDVINGTGTAQIDVPLAAFDTNKIPARSALMQGPMDTPMTMIFGGVVSTISDAQGQFFEDGNVIEVRTNAAPGTVVWSLNLDPSRIPSSQYILLMLHKRAKLVAEAKIELIGPPNVYGALLIGLVPFYLDRSSPPTNQELLFYQNQVVAMNQSATFEFMLHRIVPENQSAVYWDNMKDLVGAGSKRGPTAYASVLVPLQTVFNNTSAPVYLKPYVRLSQTAVYSYLDFGAVAVVYKTLTDYWSNSPGTDPSPDPDPNPIPSVGVDTIQNYQGKTLADIAKAYGVTGTLSIATNGNKTFNSTTTSDPARIEGAVQNGKVVDLLPLKTSKFQLRTYQDEGGNVVDISGDQDVAFPCLVINTSRDEDSALGLNLGDWKVYMNKDKNRFSSTRGAFDSTEVSSTWADRHNWLTDGNYLWSVSTLAKTNEISPYFVVDGKVLTLTIKVDNSNYTFSWGLNGTSINKATFDTEIELIRYQSTKTLASGEMLCASVSPSWKLELDDQGTHLNMAFTGTFEPTLLSDLYNQTQVVQTTSSAASLPSTSTNKMLRLEFVRDAIVPVTMTDYTQSGPLPNWTPVINQLCENYLQQHPNTTAVEFIIQLVANSQTIAVVRYYKSYGCCTITTPDPAYYHSIPSSVTADSVKIVNVSGADASSIHPVSDIGGWTSYYVSQNATLEEQSQLANYLKDVGLSPLERTLKKLKLSSIPTTSNESAAALAMAGSNIFGQIFGGIVSIHNTDSQIAANSKMAQQYYQFQADQNSRYMDFTAKQRDLDRELYNHWQSAQLNYGYWNSALQANTQIQLQTSVNKTNMLINEAQIAAYEKQAEIQRNWSMYLTGVSNTGGQQSRQLPSFTSNMSTALSSQPSVASDAAKKSSSSVQIVTPTETMKPQDTPQTPAATSSASTRASIQTPQTPAVPASPANRASKSGSSDDLHDADEYLAEHPDTKISKFDSNYQGISPNTSRHVGLIDPNVMRNDDTKVDLNKHFSSIATTAEVHTVEPPQSINNGGGLTSSSNPITDTKSQNLLSSDISNDISGTSHPSMVEPNVSRTFDSGPLASTTSIQPQQVIDAKNYPTNNGPNTSLNQVSTGNVSNLSAKFNSVKSSPVAPSQPMPLSTYKPSYLPAGHGVGDYGAVSTTTV